MKANRRYPIPLGAEQEPRRVSYARSLLPAAVAYFSRWPT